MLDDLCTSTDATPAGQDEGGMIEIEGLTKVFEGHGEPVPALHDISLHVEQGEVFGIVGRSGAGKSTLVRCINLLERRTSGRVVVAGKDLTALDELALRGARRDIGMIFQLFNLLSSLTVLENVAFPLELTGKRSRDVRGEVLPLLDLVGLADKRDRYPAELSPRNPRCSSATRPPPRSIPRPRSRTWRSSRTSTGTSDSPSSSSRTRCRSSRRSATAWRCSITAASWSRGACSTSSRRRRRASRAPSPRARGGPTVRGPAQHPPGARARGGPGDVLEAVAANPPRRPGDRGGRDPGARPQLEDALRLQQQEAAAAPLVGSFGIAIFAPCGSWSSDFSFFE